MKNRFENKDLMMTALACLLAVCVGCDATGEPQPQPTPEPQPSPSPTVDPINTNGAGDPVNTNGTDPVNTNGAEPVNTNGADPINTNEPDTVDTNGPNPIDTNGADPMGTNGADPVNTNGPVDSNGQQQTPTQAELLIGTWRLDLGTLLNDHFGGFDLTYVDFKSGGKAAINYKDPVTGVNECRSAKFSYGDDGEVLIDIEAEGDQAFRFTITDSDKLQLTDGDLLDSAFSRESTVPDLFACRILQEEKRFELPLRVDGAAELVTDGVSLWVTERNSENGGYFHFPVNPTTGVVGAPVDFGAARQIRFMQDSDIWSTCGCGGNRFLDRFAADSLASSDNVGIVELGWTNARIRAAAMNPSNGDVLTHVYDSSTEAFWFLLIERDQKDDDLKDAAMFDLSFESIVYDSSLVWALRGDYLVLINPASFTVMSTHRLPDPTVIWQGVTMLDDEIWVLGINEDGDASTLMRVSGGQVNANPDKNGG